MGMHFHRWQKVSEQFNPAARTLTNIRNVSEDGLIRLVYGFTVITYKCARCPKERHDLVTGRASA